MTQGSARAADLPIPAAAPVEGLVSIILVNLNCGDFVPGVLRAIARQTYPAIEVIVVDNGSTDGSIAQIRTNCPSATVIERGRNTGFSAAVNAGIAGSRGEFILSLNFDVDLEPGFVGALVEELRHRPEAGWAAGAMRQLGPGGPLDAIDCNGHHLLRSRYCYGYDPERPSPSSYHTVEEVFGASGCAALYRRRMLEDIAIDGEIFDESLFAYFEDVDVDWRAQQAGYRCLFVPGARGAHVRGGTGLSARDEVAALLLANRFLVMLKNDTWRDVWHDLGPIARRTLADVKQHLARGRPRVLWLAGWRLARLGPAMWWKRRRVTRRPGGGPAPAARWRSRSGFLG
jgi:GT2 family glycosyltransferase